MMVQRIDEQYYKNRGEAFEPQEESLLGLRSLGHLILWYLLFHQCRTLFINQVQFQFYIKRVYSNDGLTTPSSQICSSPIQTLNHPFTSPTQRNTFSTLQVLQYNHHDVNYSSLLSIFALSWSRHQAHDATTPFHRQMPLPFHSSRKLFVPHSDLKHFPPSKKKPLYFLSTSIP